MKLSDLGFKSFPQEFDWALPNGNVRVEQSRRYKGFWTLELDKNFKSDKYDHLLYVDRIPTTSLMKFLKNNIEGLKEFDKSPNKAFVNKIRDEVRSLSKPLRFKNMWINYNFDMPSNATKGILYDIDFFFNKDKDSKTLPAKVDKILSSLKKTPFSEMMPSSSISDGSCFLYNKTKQEKKQGLEIPYISRIDKRLKKEDEDYGYYGAVLMSNTYKGKFKGVGTNATIYYFVLIMGGDTEDDIGNPAVCVEVITPLDKGEDFFLKEVKGAVAKFNPLKFTGKKIYVNKCPKAVTGSAEMKTYSYKGEVITASSKEEAIKQIIASFSFKEYGKYHIFNPIINKLKYTPTSTSYKVSRYSTNMISESLVLFIKDKNSGKLNATGTTAQIIVHLYIKDARIKDDFSIDKIEVYVSHTFEGDNDDKYYREYNEPNKKDLDKIVINTAKQINKSCEFVNG